MTDEMDQQIPLIEIAPKYVANALILLRVFLVEIRIDTVDGEASVLQILRYRVGRFFERGDFAGADERNERATAGVSCASVLC